MIGRLDQRITLQRATATADGMGGQTVVWGNLPSDAVVWARAFTAAGREGMDNERIAATAATIFTIYNRSDLTELDRILWGGVPYNIRTIKRASGRDLFLTIEAERGVAS